MAIVSNESRINLDTSVSVCDHPVLDRHNPKAIQPVITTSVENTELSQTYASLRVSPPLPLSKARARACVCVCVCDSC